MNSIGCWNPTVEELQALIKQAQTNNPQSSGQIKVMVEPMLTPGTMVVSLDVWEMLKEGKL